MTESLKEVEQIHYPYIIFTLRNNFYCINSKYVQTIMQMPEYEEVPDAPSYITGIYTHRSQIVKMLDLRCLLGEESLTSEFNSFSKMIDERKQDHVKWVDALIHSAHTGERFSLATDPHQCAFGRWYDNYHPENATIAFQLKKLEEPHRRLHQTALALKDCSCETARETLCRDAILDEAQNRLMPQVVRLLDETKEISRTNVYHEMVLVMDGSLGLGLVVDEVLAVEDLIRYEGTDAADEFGKSRFFSSVRKSQKMEGMIMELKVDALTGVDTHLSDAVRASRGIQ